MAEGFRRIAIVLRWAALLWFFGMAYIARYESAPKEAYIVWWIAAVPAVMALVLAWIIDGFVQRRDDHPRPS